jgi:hypothetical protein
MTVVYVGNGKYLALTADTKPTTAATNAELWETDTSKLWRYNGTTWRPEYIKNPSSMIVFKEGTTYYAQEADGTIVSSSTTDASVVINAAIAGIPGAASRGWGGKVSIYPTNYDCKTEIAADYTVLAYHGVTIEGEGLGTRLHFTPATSLTNGIKLRMNYPTLRNVMVWGNENVVNLVKGDGGPTNTQYNWGVIENCAIYGKHAGPPNGNSGAILPGNDPGTGVPYVPITGQTGLYLQGDGSASAYFLANWKIHNCEFFALDTGVKIIGQYADMCNHSNIHIGACNVGYLIEGVQHNLSNFRIESGGTGEVGTTGIRLKPSAQSGIGGNVNLLNNINIELRGSNSHGLLIDNGSANNKITNIYNSASDDMTKHTIIDNSKQVGLNTVTEVQYTSPANTRRRTGVAYFGLGKTANGLNVEQGILAGCVKRQLDGVDTTFATVQSTAGPYMNLTTATTVNSVACVFYNNSEGNRIMREQFPIFYLRFNPVSITSVRLFIGMWNQFAAPTGSADILANRRGFGLYLDTSVSSNWKFMHNDNSASSTIADFPTLVLGSTTYGPNAASNSIRQAVTVSFNSTNPSANVRHHGLAYDYKTTAIPSTDNLGFLIYIENLAAGAARTIRLFDAELTLTTTT